MSELFEELFGATAKIFPIGTPASWNCLPHYFWFGCFCRDFKGGRTVGKILQASRWNNITCSGCITPFCPKFAALNDLAQVNGGHLGHSFYVIERTRWG